VDKEVRALRTSDPTVDYVDIEPCDLREAPGQGYELVDPEVVLRAVQELYERSAEAQRREAPKKKRSWKRERDEGQASTDSTDLPCGPPRTVLTQRRGKWVAEDPDWVGTVGRHKDSWLAEHSLRVQVALRIWRLTLGIKGGRGPLPCRLDEYDGTWVAASMRHVSMFMSKDDLPAPWPVCGVGKTAVEAMFSLCEALGVNLDSPIPAPWGGRREDFRSESGPDPDGP
jgi:hypothetical protein